MTEKLKYESWKGVFLASAAPIQNLFNPFFTIARLSDLFINVLGYLKKNIDLHPSIPHPTNNPF
ncbi:MAG: hypothetical protein ACJART_002463 [Maribacter sp.]|mgnify:CR=1 FL=1|jgi:hypothetical protein|tara:strand:+ start:921 stop:1112 length:192 start_codon:yes stop_codon:yes gene_type:complete